MRNYKKKATINADQIEWTKWTNGASEWINDVEWVSEWVNEVVRVAFKHFFLVRPKAKTKMWCVLQKTKKKREKIKQQNEKNFYIYCTYLMVTGSLDGCWCLTVKHEVDTASIATDRPTEKQRMNDDTGREKIYQPKSANDFSFILKWHCLLVLILIKITRKTYHF